MKCGENSAPRRGRVGQPILTAGEFLNLFSAQSALRPKMRMAACLIGAAALVIPATGFCSGTADAYQGIVARNVFDVHELPPAPPPDPMANRPPPPNIKLQGLTDILGRKMVIMKVQLPGGKPGQGGKDEAFTLTEGQRQGEIEVLAIDVAAGTVKVNNYGVITNLSLEENGEKLAAGPVAPPPNAAPGIHPPTIPPPSIPTPGAGRFPPRTLRLPGRPQSSVTTPSTPSSGVATYGGGTPSRTYADPNQRYTFDNADEQALMIEAERLKYKQEGDYRADLLPPTHLNPTANTVQPQ